MRHLNMIYNGNTLYFVALKFFKARLKRVIIANPLSSGQVISVKLSIRNTHWHSKSTTTSFFRITIFTFAFPHVGFMTTKGELVRAILFPPPLDFAFHRDFLKSIYVFLTLGLIGMSYSVTMWIRNGVSQIILQFTM